MFTNGLPVFFPSKALQEVLHGITEIFTPLDDDHGVLDLSRCDPRPTDWKKGRCERYGHKNQLFMVNSAKSRFFLVANIVTNDG